MESATTPDTSPELSDFAARVQRETSRRGFPEARRQAMLGHGATWIWNTGSELFPQATQILDRFHAKEHLGEVGKVIYGDGPEGKA
jgi:transposase